MSFNRVTYLLARFLGQVSCAAGIVRLLVVETATLRDTLHVLDVEILGVAEGAAAAEAALKKVPSLQHGAVLTVVANARRLGFPGEDGAVDLPPGFHGHEYGGELQEADDDGDASEAADQVALLCRRHQEAKGGVEEGHGANTYVGT